MDPMSMTIEQIASSHYLPEKRVTRRANTVEGYESSINLHVLPRWGTLTITEIRRDDIQSWVREFEKPGAAKKAFTCLRQILRWAIRKWSLLVADPTLGIELPRMRKYRFETLNSREYVERLRTFWGAPARTGSYPGNGPRPEARRSLRPSMARHRHEVGRGRRQQDAAADKRTRASRVSDKDTLRRPPSLSGWRYAQTIERHLAVARTTPRAHHRRSLPCSRRGSTPEIRPKSADQGHCYTQPQAHLGDLGGRRRRPY